jgi:hypothetical protein
MLYLVTGTLKGYDQLMNLVLDDVKEITRGMPIPPFHPHLTLHPPTLISYTTPLCHHLLLTPTTLLNKTSS